MVDFLSNLHFFNGILILIAGTITGVWGLILFFMKKQTIIRPWRIALIFTGVVAFLQAIFGIILVAEGQHPGTGTRYGRHHRHINHRSHHDHGGQ